MDSNKTAASLRAGGLSHSHVGAITGAVIFLIGVVMMFDSWRLDAGWEADGPASGYFPFRIGAILCLAAANVVFRCLFGKERDHRVFVTWDRLRLVRWRCWCPRWPTSRRCSSSASTSLRRSSSAHSCA
jgi:putative tricarboxylic transport membrane protein